MNKLGHVLSAGLLASVSGVALAGAASTGLPSIDGFEHFKKDTAEAYYLNADIMSGLFVRGYVPINSLGSNQVHLFGQGIYTSGTQRFAPGVSVNLSQYGFGGGIGGWTPLFQSADGEFKVAAIGNVGARYASVSASGYSNTVFGMIWDAHLLASMRSVPGLKFGLGWMDSGTGLGNDQNHIGPIHASYQFTPNLAVSAYLGSTSAIGVEYKY